MAKKWEISRRRFLRGLGTAMSLPLLEVMLPSMAKAQALTPFRFGYVYWPMGSFSESRLYPQYFADAFDPVKDDVSILGGFTNYLNERQAYLVGERHHSTLMTMLNDGSAEPTGNNNYDMQVTLDQLIAEKFYSSNKFPSLHAKLVTQYDAPAKATTLYSNNMSWNSNGKPMPNYFEPRAIFNALFGNNIPKEMQKSDFERLQRKRNILDLVLSDIQDLNKTLGLNDKKRFEQYLTGVEELDRKLASMQTEGPVENVTCDMSKKPAMSHQDYPPTVDYGANATYPIKLELTQDVFVKALECDATRVFTFMHTAASAHLNHSWLNAGQWHHASHYGTNNTKAEYTLISKWHFEQMAKFVQKLKATPDLSPINGPGNLLDNSLIVFGSNFHNGHWHDAEGLHYCLAGTGGGRFKTGLRHNYPKFGNNKSEPHTNLWLTIAQQAGLARTKFGDSTRQLNDLLT